MAGALRMLGSANSSEVLRNSPIGSDPRVPRNDRQIGSCLRWARSLHDVECRNRTAKTPQLQISEILQPRHRFDCFSDAAADKDLPVLGLGTQPGREVAHRTDRGVAGALRKSDLAQCGVTLCDAGAETKFAAIVAPNRDQLEPSELASV